MKIAAGVATDIGRVREGNEDSYLAEHPALRGRRRHGRRTGAARSRRSSRSRRSRPASRAAAARWSTGARTRTGPCSQRSGEDRAVSGMGTTLTAAVVRPDGLDLAHVGDSRAYLLRGGALRRLTEDHTLVNRMIARRRDHAPTRPRSTRTATSCCGRSGPSPTWRSTSSDVGLLDGDRVILCSDGLTTMITEEQIVAIASAAARPAGRRRPAGAGGEPRGRHRQHHRASCSTCGDRGGRSAAGRHRPARRAAGRSGGTVAIGGAIAVVVLVAALTACRAWLDTRWYVGVSDGHVAVFQGIPVEVLGFDLSRVDLETSVDAAAAAGDSRSATARGRRERRAAARRRSTRSSRRSSPTRGRPRRPEERRRRDERPRRRPRAAGPACCSCSSGSSAAVLAYALQGLGLRRTCPARPRRVRRGVPGARRGRLVRGAQSWRAAPTRSCTPPRSCSAGSASRCCSGSWSTAASARSRVEPGGLARDRPRGVRGDAGPDPRHPPARRVHVHDRAGRADPAAPADRARASAGRDQRRAALVPDRAARVPARRVRSASSS